LYCQLGKVIPRVVAVSVLLFVPTLNEDLRISELTGVMISEKTIESFKGDPAVS